MANLGPMMGNANHFTNYARTLVDDPRLLEYGDKRFTGEVDRFAGVMDGQLSATRYLGGDEYTIADIITFPWATLLDRMHNHDGSMWQEYTYVKRWVDEVHNRPAVAIGREVGENWGKQDLTPEQQKAREDTLFNQSNAKVRAAREAALKKV
jgi:GST-like protein